MSKDRGHIINSPKTDEAVLSLMDWYQQPQGRYLWDQLDTQLERWVPEIFGYHALWLGPLPDGEEPFRHSRIRHHCRMSPIQAHTDVRSSLDALPIQSESVDLVVMLHTLELSPDPHQILREVDRVLVPEGEILIVHFNPVSWYGLWRVLLRWRGLVPWCLPFYTGFRIRDWLSLLGYDVQGNQGWGFRPPFHSAGLNQRLEWYERFSGKYLPIMNGLSMIRAKKRVATLTPIRRRWKPGRRLMGNGKLAEPTSRENGFVRRDKK